MDHDYRLDHPYFEDEPEPRRGIAPGKRSLTQSLPAQLPAPLRARFEQSFGVDLSPVRVHVDGAAEAMGADAFAQGRDIHVAPRHYDPGSTAGAELLGHEVAHVLQQADGRVAATRQFRGRAVNDDPALEAEADAAGARAAAGQPAGLPTRGDLGGLGGGVAQGKFTRFSDIDQNKAGYVWGPHQVTGNYAGSDTPVDGVKSTLKFEYFSTAADQQIVRAICLPPPAVPAPRNRLLPGELGGPDVLHNRLNLRAADEATLGTAQADAIAGGAKFPIKYEATAFYGAPHDPRVNARPTRVEVTASIIDPQNGGVLDGPHTQTATFAADPAGNDATADALDLTQGREPATMKTTITWAPPHANGDGHKVTATIGPDHPLGSAPTKAVQGMSGFLSGDSTSYIAGHLLNDHLGGPGHLPDNIAAIPSQINSNMSGQFEEHVKEFVNEQHGWGKFEVTTATAHDPDYSDKSGNPYPIDYTSSIAASFQAIDLTGTPTGAALTWNATIDTPSHHNPDRDQTVIAASGGGGKKKKAKATTPSAAADVFAPGAGVLGAPTVTSTPTVHDVVFVTKNQARVVLDARQEISNILESLHFSPAVYDAARAEGILETLLAHLTPDAALTAAMEEMRKLDEWRRSFDLPVGYTIKHLRDAIGPGLVALDAKAHAVQELGASGIFEGMHRARQLEALLNPLVQTQRWLQGALQETSHLPDSFYLFDWFKPDRATGVVPPEDGSRSPARVTDDYVKGLGDSKLDHVSLTEMRGHGRGLTFGEVATFHMPVALSGTSSRTPALVGKIKGCAKSGDVLSGELRTRIADGMMRFQLSGLIEAAANVADEPLMTKMVDGWLTSGFYSADALESFTKVLDALT